MNKPTVFDQLREAKRKGEILCCPFCGQELARREKDFSSDDFSVWTFYSRHPSGTWMWPQEGAQTRRNHQQRERRRASLKVQEFETPQELAREAKSEKQFERTATRQIVRNVGTGEAKPLHHKDGGRCASEVRGTGIFQCRQCAGRVKIVVSK